MKITNITTPNKELYYKINALLIKYQDAPIFVMQNLRVKKSNKYILDLSKIKDEVYILYRNIFDGQKATKKQLELPTLKPHKMSKSDYNEPNIKL